MVLPGNSAPASKNLRITGKRRPPLHCKAVVLEGELEILSKHFLVGTEKNQENIIINIMSATEI
jgi:hypothetical protein